MLLGQAPGEWEVQACSRRGCGAGEAAGAAYLSSMLMRTHLFLGRQKILQVYFPRLLAVLLRKTRCIAPKHANGNPSHQPPRLPLGAVWFCGDG